MSQISPEKNLVIANRKHRDEKRARLAAEAQEEEEARVKAAEAKDKADDPAVPAETGGDAAPEPEVKDKTEEKRKGKKRAASDSANVANKVPPQGHMVVYVDSCKRCVNSNHACCYRAKEKGDSQNTACVYCKKTKQKCEKESEETEIKTLHELSEAGLKIAVLDKNVKKGTNDNEEEPPTPRRPRKKAKGSLEDVRSRAESLGSSADPTSRSESVATSSQLVKNSQYVPTLQSLDERMGRMEGMMSTVLDLVQKLSARMDNK